MEYVVSGLEKKNGVRTSIQPGVTSQKQWGCDPFTSTNLFWGGKAGVQVLARAKKCMEDKTFISFIAPAYIQDLKGVGGGEESFNCMTFQPSKWGVHRLSLLLRDTV